MDMGGSIFLLVAAPFVGSFLGVLVERLPVGRPVVMGRSHCDACGHALGPLELLPVVSWLLSRRRCRHCGARLSLFYPMIELAASLVAAWALVVVPWPLAAATAGLGWVLLALAEKFQLDLSDLSSGEGDRLLSARPPTFPQTIAIAIGGGDV